MNWKIYDPECSTQRQRDGNIQKDMGYKVIKCFKLNTLKDIIGIMEKR